MSSCCRLGGNSVVRRDNGYGEFDNTSSQNDNSREKCDNTQEKKVTTATGKIKMYGNSKKPGTYLFIEAGSGRFFYFRQSVSMT